MMSSTCSTLLSALMFFALVVCLSGCSDVAKPPWAAEGHGDKIPAEDCYRIVFADETLKKHDVVRVTRVVPDRKPNNRLEIYCELVNRSKQDLRIQIQTAFKDGRNRIIEETTWHTVLMSALSGTSYTICSTTMDADDYLVRIRLASPAIVFD